MTQLFQDLRQTILHCRICVDHPAGKPLPHQPRPVLHASARAPIVLCGQAPGARVHESGVPFLDRSGDRLRQWLGVDKTAFYNLDHFSIIPMGFCFPGNDAKGGDLPPRPECRTAWHDQIFSTIPQPKLLILIGRYAVDYHFARLGLSALNLPKLNDTIANWRNLRAAAPFPLWVLPHPSWRNTGWLKQNQWFESEILPLLRADVTNILG